MSTNATESTPTPVRERVQSVINLIRPAVQADGGDIELVDVTAAGVVQIRFHGACNGCPSSALTLKSAVEEAIMRAAPDVERIVHEAEEMIRGRLSRAIAA